MQIHELTQPRLDEALGAAGSFLSGLTGGLTDRLMDKTPGAGKPQNTSEKWKDRYDTLDNDPAVASYVKNLATGWATNAPKADAPTQGLASSATLQRMVPSLVTAAKKSNNNLTSTQIGQILAKSAPNIWKNTPDKADPAKPNQVDKATAIKQLASELSKQGISVDRAGVAPTTTAAPAPTATTAPVAAPAPTAPTATTAVAAPAKPRTGGKVAGQVSQTPNAVRQRNARNTPANAGAGAFGQMANRLTTPATTSSAGGKIQTTPTGLVHTAKPGQPPTITPAVTTAPAVAAATPKVRAKYPKAPAAGAIAEPPKFLGGKRLDPKNPNDAQILSALQKQGKLNEAALIGPKAEQYKAKFIDWSDGQLATRVRETGTSVTMDQVRQQFPDLAQALNAALDSIVQTQGTTQQPKAVAKYIKLAVAGVQARAQMDKNKMSSVERQQNKQFADTSYSVKQSLRDAGIDPADLAQFGAQAKADGTSMQAKRTGNPALDTMAKLAGFTLI